MNPSIDLLTLATQQPFFPESMVLLQEKHFSHNHALPVMLLMVEVGLVQILQIIIGFMVESLQISTKLLRLDTQKKECNLGKACTARFK